MPTSNQHLVLGAEAAPDLTDFLSTVADEDLLKFLRRLPMIAGQEDGSLTFADLIYEMLLWPYVQQAWKTVDGSPGIPGRLSQLTRVYEIAERGLARDTGRRRRLDRVVNLPAFINPYSTEGLP